MKNGDLGRSLVSQPRCSIPNCASWIRLRAAHISSRLAPVVSPNTDVPPIQHRLEVRGVEEVPNSPRLCSSQARVSSWHVSQHQLSYVARRLYKNQGR